MKRNVTGLIADFHHPYSLQRILKKRDVEVPEGWNFGVDHFQVVEDLGDTLVLAFWDYDQDQQVGETTFCVDRLTVECWG